MGALTSYLSLQQQYAELIAQAWIIELDKLDEGWV
jgi:hypothetical protein